MKKAHDHLWVAVRLCSIYPKYGWPVKGLIAPGWTPSGLGCCIPVLEYVICPGVEYVICPGVAGIAAP